MVEFHTAAWPLTGRETVVPLSGQIVRCGPDVPADMANGTSAVTIWTQDETEARLLAGIPSEVVRLALCGSWTVGCTLVASDSPGGALVDIFAAAPFLQIAPLPAGRTQTIRRPSLTCPHGEALPAWMATAWQNWRGRTTVRSAIEVTALEAGLRCLHDDFEGCHQAAQSIEGRGQRHGDYWHAILHRREPDYGNSRYWFRQVGRHALFDALRDEVQRVAQQFAHPHFEEWLPRLIAGGEWRPAAFADCVAAAVNHADREFRRVVEEVQYREMLLLLAQTCRDAV
jgi:hypothetical protein